MGALDGLLSPLLTQTANARGSYLAGQRTAQDKGIQEAMTRIKLQRDAEAQGVKEALEKAQTVKALRPDVPNNVYLPTVDKDGNTVYGTAPSKGPPVITPTTVQKPATPPPSAEVVVPGAEGGPVIVNKKTGTSRSVAAPGAAPGTTPPGDQRLHMQPPPAVTTGHVENEKKVRNITDAIAKVQAHPSAVGLLRGASDDVDQRVDPQGVDARAALADIGSMVVHDRSGAAVTVTEYPRLAAFIPRVRDNAETVVKKLKRMAEIIKEENLAIETAYPGIHQAPTDAGGDSEFDALLTKYKKP